MNKRVESFTINPLATIRDYCSLQCVDKEAHNQTRFFGKCNPPSRATFSCFIKRSTQVDPFFSYSTIWIWIFSFASKFLYKYLFLWKEKFQVFLPFGVRQFIEKKINDKDVDCTLFDEAIKHVEQVLKNDPYVRFLQSNEYIGLLEKLHWGNSLIRENWTFSKFFWIISGKFLWIYKFGENFRKFSHNFSIFFSSTIIIFKTSKGSTFH